MKTYVFLVSTDTFSFYHLTDASHKTWAQKGLFSQSSLFGKALRVCLVSLCLMASENYYLNAIYNRFTMVEWEDSRVKSIWPWSEPGSVAAERWSLGTLSLNEMKRRRCRWLPRPQSVLARFLLLSEDTNHTALCLPGSHSYTGSVCCRFLSALWEPEKNKSLCQCFLTSSDRIKSSCHKHFTVCISYTFKT